MKPKIFFALLIFFSCQKEQAVTKQVNALTQQESVVADTMLIPLIDMGSQTFRSYSGGLYPNGSNLPSGTYANDLHDFALSIAPLDSNGNINNTKGIIGFISIGASTCNIMMTALRDKTSGNPLTNPKLRLVACTSGATSVNEIMDPANGYWNVVQTKLSKAALKAKQVQVIYMETEDSVQTNDFPGRPLRTKTEYEQAMRTFKIKFPNIKLVYLLGRAHTFVPPRKNKITNTEPTPYYNGWACKWVIEDQINGVNGTAYKGAHSVSPLVTWGWYQWGTEEPRSDGFIWKKEYTKEDGLHANDIGADTLSTRFQNFLLTDEYAGIWYANHGQ